MRAIHIPQLLNAPNKTMAIDVDEHLSGLETLTAVKGEMSVTHQGTYLDVKGQCRGDYDFGVRSLLAKLQHPSTGRYLRAGVAGRGTSDEAIEKEVDLEDLIESVSPKGNFKPDEWLYEQMCLAIPQKQICSSDCKGIAFKNPEPEC